MTALHRKVLDFWINVKGLILPSHQKQPSKVQTKMYRAIFPDNVTSKDKDSSIGPLEI